MGAANAKKESCSPEIKVGRLRRRDQTLRDKKIVFIAGDMSDAGTYGVFMAIEEAVNGAGWQLLSIDCRGRCNQSANVVAQALEMKPSGIVLAGVDAASQTKGLTAAAVAKGSSCRLACQF